MKTQKTFIISDKVVFHLNVEPLKNVGSMNLNELRNWRNKLDSEMRFLTTRLRGVKGDSMNTNTKSRFHVRLNMIHKLYGIVQSRINFKNNAGKTQPVRVKTVKTQHVSCTVDSLMRFEPSDYTLGL